MNATPSEATETAHDACTAEIERAKAQSDQLAYAVSHDLVAHVRHLNGFLALLAASDGPNLSADGQESLAFCSRAADSLSQMCQALLTYSRIGRKESPFERVDMATAVQQALEGLHEDQRPNVTQNDLPILNAEPEHMAELWRQLLGNAAKFRSADRSPAVEITSKNDGEAWTIEVRDNGVGVAERDWTRMFGMFVQLQARGTVPGVGAGLAIAKRIVERHGGSIAVAESSASGTTLYMRLPTGKASESPR